MKQGLVVVAVAIWMGYAERRTEAEGYLALH